MKMKVYLAGKITGDPNYREKFAAAANLIENQQNHIRALMQANDALRPAWVPVTERLPEHTVCVLVAYSNGAVEVDAWGHDGWMDEDLSNGAITHWMPVPEPPEVEWNE